MYFFTSYSQNVIVFLGLIYLHWQDGEMSLVCSNLYVLFSYLFITFVYYGILL